MINLNGSQTQQKIEDDPTWIFSKNEKNERDARIHEAITSDRQDEAAALFSAYQETKSTSAEHDLLVFVARQLTAKAKWEYRKVYYKFPNPYGATSESAEEMAADVTVKIREKLLTGYFESHEHLLAYMALKCRKFHGEAQVANANDKLRRFVPLFGQMTDENGNIVDCVRDLPFVVPRSPRIYRNRENNLLLKFLSDPDACIFQTLEECEWDRSYAAERLGMTEDALNSRVSDIGTRFQDMRMLMLAFRVPRPINRPIEHKEDIRSRLVAFVDRLRRLETRPQFPQTFAHAFALCAEKQPKPTGEHYWTAHEIVRHLVRLWRKTQTTQ